jgi:hypothetical protein
VRDLAATYDEPAGTVVAPGPLIDELVALIVG